MNKEISTLLYDIEGKINIEKEWIDIANILAVEHDNTEFKISLILNEIEKINTDIYNDYEILIENLQNLYVNFP